jgi:hypothetical protein
VVVSLGFAIKILAETLAAEPVTLARFEHGAQAVAALSRPNMSTSILERLHDRRHHARVGGEGVLRG